MLSVQKPQNVSLIDTLSDGYRAVNRRPWLVIIPIIFNLYIWFGPQLSFAPLIADWQTLTRAFQQESGTPWQQISPEMQQQSEQQLQEVARLDMRQPLAVFNYIPFAVYVLGSAGLVGSGLGVPLVQALPQTIDAQRSVIAVQNLGGALLAFLLINGIVLLLSAVFMTTTAEAVRSEPFVLQQWLRRAGHAMLSILGYAAVLLSAVLLIGLPVVVVTVFLMALIPALGAFALLLLLITWFWATIYLGFALEAIVVSGVGPLRALHASFNIVRRNFMSTLLFLLLLLVIAVGSGVVWQFVVAAMPTGGALVAIVGSAYIGCGLVAARMAFYRERLQRWQLAAGTVRAETRAAPRQ